MTSDTDATFCQCDETLIDEIDPKTGKVVGKRRINPPYEHNCYYVKLRNALIPRAEWEAIQQEREQARVERRPFSDHHMSSLFSRRMDALVNRAHRISIGKAPSPGPERNRAFFAEMKRLAEEYVR